MSDYDRFRSFAERYVIERANGFRKGFEREDAWEATLDARTMFNNIGRVSKDMGDPPEMAQSASMVGQAAVNQAVNRPFQYGGPVQMQTGPAPSSPEAAGMVGAAWAALSHRLSKGATVSVDRGRQKSWRK